MGHIENDVSNTSFFVACVFVTAVTFLPSRCLATIGGFLLSRSLATIWDTHTDTQTAGRNFFTSAVEMGSGAVIYVPRFIKFGSGIQKLMGGGG
jgi:hypothetical protein